MEIVISGYYGFDNLGDEAILFSIIQELKNNLPNTRITVLSNNPDNTKELYGVNAVNRWNLLDVMKAIRQSDGLISGGGGLLQDKTSSKTISYYCGIMWIAHCFGKPVFVYSQGIGPISKYFNEKIVLLTLNKASFITVRDEVSKRLLLQLGVKKDVTVVVDPVLGIDFDDTNHSNWLKQSIKGERYISVSVRNTHSQDVIKKIASGLSPLAEKGKKIVFVPMFGSEDYHCSLEAKEKMTKEAQQHTYIAPYDLSIDEKATIIGSSELLIGMRLHSLILAVKKMTPFITISYDPKIDVFAKMCGQSIIGHVDSSSWDEQSLIMDIERRLVQKVPLAECTIQFARKAKQVAKKPASMVLKRLLINRVNMRLNALENK
ncbi:polysaccharide pyruvyl transferase CsaB [Bacillus sp. T3]|uniref:polysaccharide pyruvyl transferase CsaB n=1 Tax=Bacillus sp. T3 TaxID=467262 RepID=UPI002981848A|nr:polysaccharide pyruvyl transferase CsaB [Bacillus sp. T3]